MLNALMDYGKKKMEFFFSRMAYLICYETNERERRRKQLFNRQNERANE